MHIHHRIWLEKAGAGIAKVNRYFSRTQEETQVFIISKDTQERVEMQQGGEGDVLREKAKVG